MLKGAGNEDGQCWYGMVEFLVRGPAAELGIELVSPESQWGNFIANFLSLPSSHTLGKKLISIPYNKCHSFYLTFLNKKFLFLGYGSELAYLTYVTSLDHQIYT